MSTSAWSYDPKFTPPVQPVVDGRSVLSARSLLVEGRMIMSTRLSSRAFLVVAILSANSPTAEAQRSGIMASAARLASSMEVVETAAQQEGTSVRRLRSRAMAGLGVGAAVAGAWLFLAASECSYVTEYFPDGAVSSVELCWTNNRTRSAGLALVGGGGVLVWFGIEPGRGATPCRLDA